MAGTLTDLRKAAEWKLKQAKQAGADPRTIAQLQADYDAASSKEDAAMGKNR